MSGQTRYGWAMLLAALLLLPAGCEERAAQPGRPEAPKRVELPSLQAQLDARKQEFLKTAPPELVKTFEDGVEALRPQEKEAKKLGDKAPGFELPNATGKTVALADLLEKGPVVVTWYRGGWCPYCNIQLRALQQALPALREAGGTLVAISPELPDKALSTAEKQKLEFEVLSDVGNKVAAAYGLKYTLPAPVAAKLKGFVDLATFNGDASNDLPLAATYVIGTDGTIRYAFVDADYRKRAEPAAIVAALAKLEAD
ncbi:peroxiredoxin-like family protein [Planctomycetota bacterium]